MVNGFDVLKEMGERNLDIASAPDLMDFKRQPKKHGGLISVGVASPHFDHLMNGFALDHHTHKAVLLIYNIEQFKQVEKELDASHSQ